MAERKQPGSGRKRKSPSRARLETSSGGVVYRWHDGKPHFLLIRDPYENWGLPKGHLEGGETARDAALREVAEETGLAELRVVAQLPTIDWFFRDRGRLVHKFCHFFLLECTAGDARPQIEEGISECVWHDLEAALQIVTYANAREVLRVAGAHLNAGETEKVSADSPTPQ